jgi:hypothetical protein
MSYQNEGEGGPYGGNMSAFVSNGTPTTIMSVGGLFEFTMPANTDVRIRALTPRAVYITSEGMFPGGSFTTSTAAIVNLTTTATPVDTNVSVNGKLNLVTIHDILTGRIFRVTVWRLSAIAGNWSGWVEEIGVTNTFPILNYATNAAAIADPALPAGAQYTVTVGGFRELFLK